MMISLEQWRAAIGCFSCRGVCKSVVSVEHGNNYGCDFVMIVSCGFLCLTLVLLCCGDVERNPGPMPKRPCPECSCMVHTRKLVCECGFCFRPKPDIQNRDIVPEPIIACRIPKRICRTKRCPSYELWVKIEQSVCECGYDYYDPFADRKELHKNQQLVSMASLRASESPEALSKRNVQSKIAMASLRASESPEALSKRNLQSKIAMASLRASESPEALSKRNIQSKIAMASLRASESPHVSSKRKLQSRDCVIVKRCKVLSLEQAILDFYAIIKEGPDFVCTVCHRMMYRLAVCSYNRLKYIKGDEQMLQCIHSMEYVCSDGMQWI